MTHSERYLIVSLGSIGCRHLRNLRSLRPDATIGVWRQHSTAQAGEIPEGADQQFTSLNEVLAFGPRAAIIAGPATTHLSVAMTLAKAGVHLLVEKPIADRLEGLDALLALCRVQRLTLMIGYNLRFLPSLRETKRLLESGVIGQVLAARAEVGQYLPDWRPTSDYRQAVTARHALGGGVLLELSHELDYAYWLFGLPARIAARGGRYSQLEIDVEDTVELLLEYESPTRLVNIHLDMVQRAPTRCCRFIGESGTMVWDAIRDRIECFTVESGCWEILDQFALADRNRMYVDELVQFLHCVESGETPLVGGEQGYDVLAMVTAARDSIEQRTSLEVSGYG